MNFKRYTDSDKIYNLYIEGDEPSDDMEGVFPDVQARKDSSALDQLIPSKLNPRVTSASIKYTQGRPHVDPKMLQHFIKYYYNRLVNSGKVSSTLIYGEPGIGKTQIVQQTAKEIAASQNRVFVTIEKVDTPGHPSTQDILNEPTKYFMLIDKSTGDMTEEEIGGFPSPFEGSEYTKIKPMEWTQFMTLPPSNPKAPAVQQGLNGIIFFDEIGHARDEVQKVLFRVIEDRKLGNRPISSGMAIHAATNLPDSISAGSGSSEILAPLINRLDVVQLIPNPVSWGRWARNNNVHPLVIMYANYEPEKTFYLDPEKMSQAERARFSDSKPFPTPRSVTKFGQSLTDNMILANEIIESAGSLDPELIERITGNPLFQPGGGVVLPDGQLDVDRLWEFIFHEAAQKCGEVWEKGFRAFVHHYMAINWQEYIDNPKQVAGIDAYTFTGLVIYISKAIITAFEESEVSLIEMRPRARKKNRLHIPIYNSLIEMMTYLDHDKRILVLINTGNESGDAVKFFSEYIDYGDYDQELRAQWIGAKNAEDLGEHKQDARGILGKIRDELRSMKGSLPGIGAKG